MNCFCKWVAVAVVSFVFGVGGACVHCCCFDHHAHHNTACCCDVCDCCKCCECDGCCHK